ncbi:ATP-binding protein [Oscillatoria sp. FACHB-1406]|uniref:GAF domain-containing sensor histidine kinase n=1 Tax=Oscillatoria sp. FACHB-1406 TaxID=2692846 RepID=UPI001685889A|nr:ATP-binding protein [Oscillatoria sp. FACHB-1406]MBD2580557.1 GAF domain-containing protein [Oscillatoria sp. FACHB-1406]
MEEFNTLGQQILQIAQSNLEPPALLSRIVARIGEVFGVDRCWVVAAPERGIKTLSGFWPVEPSILLTPEFKTQWSAVADCAGLEPLAVEDLASEAGKTALGELVGLLSVRAWLSYPLGEKRSPRGWIALLCNDVRSWSAAEREELERLSVAVSLICDRADFQQQVSTYKRYQTPIGRLSQVLYTASEVEPDLESALAETALALQVDRGLLMTLKYADPLQKNRRRTKVPKAKVTEIASWSRQAEPAEVTSVDTTFALADCFLYARAWQNAPEPMVIDDLDLYPDPEALALPPLLARDRMKAWLLVPLVGRSGNDAAATLAVGFLLFQARYPRVWQPEEVDLARWVGEQLSTAMLQNQAQRQVQALVEERTAQLRWSLELQAKLSEKMRLQIDELKRVNQIKDEFLATVQDELKHPLAKMKMAIEMLKIAPDTQRRQIYLEILESECAKETKLIVDILTLQQLRSHQFSSDRQQLDLREIIEAVAHAFEQRWADKGLILEIDDGLAASADNPSKVAPTLFADANSINRILLELLSNAGRFSLPQTRVILAVRSQLSESGRQILLTVTNTGVGILPHEQEIIFDPFTQIRREGSEQGTGLGLALVRELVKHLNGAISVSSTLVDAKTSAYLTSFTLTLPQSQPAAPFWDAQG